METLPLTDEDDDEQPPPLSSENRRKSIFTRGYDPNDQDENLDVYPKSEEAKKKLEDSVKDNLLFRGLEPEQLMAIIDAMKEVIVRKGDEIIKQGEDGDYFYVIDKGTYEVHVKKENGEESIMQTYVGRGCFGELALMYNQPRQATVRAVTDGTVFSLERDLFNKIVVKSAHVRRKLYGELIDKVSLFETLTEYEKLKIADVLYTLVFSDGDSIIKQGETADGHVFRHFGKRQDHEDSRQ
uniref:cAMP-dependent protein kinase type II regulatory subunit n=1 Tax=Lygus hesperus TaxID=30085 RepID=A0A0A9WT96_LYGHE